jgi:hypothetical protein
MVRPRRRRSSGLRGAAFTMEFVLPARQGAASRRRVEARGWPIRVGDAVHGGLAVMGARRGTSRGSKKRVPTEALDPSLGTRLEMDRRVWNAPPPLDTLHTKAPEVMKAPLRAYYNFVTLGQGYDKPDGPWTRALVDRARRGTTNVV